MSTRRLPPEVRARLLAIPVEAGRAPSRRLPQAVRARLLAIPSRATTAPTASSPWLRRWLVDGRLAIAASALLAVLVAPLVEAAGEPSQQAAASLGTQLAELRAATGNALGRTETAAVEVGERLRLETLAILSSTRQDLVATGSLLEDSWTATLEWWRSPSDSPKPQGD